MTSSECELGAVLLFVKLAVVFVIVAIVLEPKMLFSVSNVTFII